MPSYVAKTGLNLNTTKKNPVGTRVEAGEEVDSSDLSKKTVTWLLERGYIEEVSTSSSRRRSRSATDSGSSSSPDEESTDTSDTDENGEEE